MAKGRFLSKQVGRSKQLASLNDRERCIFLLLLPHADVEGRLEADVDYLEGVCLTRMGYTRPQIDDAVKALHKAGLIHLYTVKGERYLAFPKFEKHQLGLRKDREAPSEIPAPPSRRSKSADDGGNTDGDTPATSAEELRSDSGTTPAQVEVEVEVQGEGEGEGEVARTRATPTPQDHPTPEEAFHQAATTGTDPTILEHKVRERIRRTAGRDFQIEHNHDIPRWSREHSPDRIDELWEAAKPEHWRGTNKADKRRVWIFEDLLNQDVTPPTEADDPLRQYRELGL